MRVLFSSTSGYGHVIPMLPLARAFRAAGHDVLWATAEQALPLVVAAGIDAVASGASGPEEAALRAAVRTQGEEMAGPARAAFVFPRMFGEALTPPMAADLVGIARDWDPDLLIHEQAELAAPLVAALLAVPSVTHSFGTAVPVEALGTSASLLAGLWQAHGLEVPQYAGCYRAGYLDICPASVQTMPVDHIRNVQQLRPVDAGPVPAPAEPLVYVTLGTVHQGADLLREVVAGIAGLGIPVLVAVGPRMSPDSLGEQPAHVQVESWVDQPAVLGRCSAVVSHGGSGTFLGALACGLPQLCLPQGADQFRNSEGGERAGASLTLRPEEVTAVSVRAAVERLLSEPDLRVGAQRVAAEIAAMPAPEAVVPLLASVDSPRHDDPRG
jgi:UDP:flavonoid glycosyltransferase YjiC (YdhE family)